ncbi:dipeptide epimerase [Erythrobacter sp. AP23]|uniref:dipeptide epimerase n=1 Tax=Erythrobacter sp. AP23 TaxID=499656 RepID=UPI00076C3422|nr:dipeptide epimerase [Erythrobacter sp. AP23]KWV92452.1 dipeptide epimerase [Erythrobacter sp. AP23]
MSAVVEIVTHPLKAPFSISGYVFDHVDTIKLTLELNEVRGRSEAAGVYYLDDTAESMFEQLRPIVAELNKARHLPTAADIQDWLPSGGPRNALDCALWDYHAKACSKRVWELAGTCWQPLRTVYTLGIDTPEAMANAAAAATGFSRIKLKLGIEDPVARVEAVRAARPEVSLIIDVNQGWTIDALRDFTPELVRLGVDMIEQPLPRGDDHALEGYVSPIPLAADESCLDMSEFAAASKRYAIINIKLDKCGGLTEALKLVKAAQDADIDLMVGNMSGSSLAMAPGYVVGQFCKFVDLDGPLLLAHDIDKAIEFGRGGLMSLPDPALWG